MNNYLTAREGMKNLISITEDPALKFDRNHYSDSYMIVYNRMVPTFDAIEELFTTVDDPDTMICNMAGFYVSAAIEKLGTVRKTREKDIIQMDLNMKLATYIYPGILQYKGESSRPLCDEIARQWKKSFPKSNVTAATFEEIEKGFHHKWCYVTTAVCRSLHKGDDCYELNTLRGYRDTYLLKQPDGAEMVRRYYDIAPSIVKHIDRREDADEIYSSIYESYIRPCIRMIQDGKNDECRDLYVEMVESLRKKYFFRQMNR